MTGDRLRVGIWVLSSRYGYGKIYARPDYFPKEWWVAWEYWMSGSSRHHERDVLKWRENYRRTAGEE